MDLTQQLEDVEKRYNALTAQMADPEVINDPEKYRKTAKMHRDLEETVGVYREYKKAVEELAQARQMIEDEDPDLRAMAQEEIARLEPATTRLEEQLEILLLPKDPNDEKNVLLEIRAGAGGDEASLFAAEIFRVYSRYADSRRWKVEVISASESGAGGSKEVIAMVGGDRVFSKLKYESGVHRVQRVPVTEQQGRIHTSTITVAVMPEADEVEIKLEPKDVRIDTFCSSGPGGQSVNTTYSAVRLTHLPTGLVVSCQDEKSQIKNRAKAERVLRSRLYELEMEKQQQAIGADRRSQVGTGDRSEKIRTYNFKENRVTDHRIGLTLHQLDRVMEGEIDELLTACVNHFNAQKLKEQAESSQADLNQNKKDDGKDRGPTGG
ncbi:peptide chain release factor 1 [uncultured Paludibaculum sp.]|uniref:peptide chain release factor 1 n=1 Tax=uncultured Paludibaculum sp. TaxID=1765020 RepID=UPI002AAA79D6|nr:peptide chain release factor 1 [uncultured Paludibaculum sp.]